MKKLITLLLLSSALLAQVQPLPPSGGPDAWGYTWKSNQDPNGPTFQWVDITSTGTKITGLGDDNFVGPINMGINFTYYWNTYSQVYVGSNGFISFGSGFNIASGNIPAFRDFPFADSKNNVIGMMLSDLTFTKSPDGSPIPGAEAYYETRGDSFIISFINVPFWSNDADANPGDYKGLNTFQIILNAADSSITINYKTNQCCVDSAYFIRQGQPIVQNFISRGMEDVTGTMGLDWDNKFSNNEGSFYLPDSSCIRIVPPPTPQTSVQDLSVNWLLNPENGGIFAEKHPVKKLGFKVNIKNVGTVDMGPTDSLKYTIRYKEPETRIVRFQSSVTIKGLKKGQDTTISFNNVLPVNKEGSYFIEVIKSLGSFNDVNPQNNSRKSEIVAATIDTTDSMATLRYDDKNWDSRNEGTISLGAGVYIEPPKYPAKIKYFEGDITIWKNPMYRSDAIIKLYKNDGPNGGIGTLLDSIYLDINQFLANVQPQDTQILGGVINQIDTVLLVRIRIPLPSETELINPGEGVYLAYLALDNSTLGFPTSVLLIDELEPFSLRTYEVIGGVWAPYRDANATDFAMGLGVKMAPDTVMSSGISTITRNVSVYPNPSSNFVHFELHEYATVEIYDVLGNKVKSTQINGRGSIYVGDLPKGVYIYRVIGNSSMKSGKIVVE